MEVQVLLPAAVCRYHSSLHCCSDSPGAAVSCSTYAHFFFFFQLLLLLLLLPLRRRAVQEEGSDQSTAPPRPEPRGELTRQPNTTHPAGGGLSIGRADGRCVDGTEKKKRKKCSNGMCKVRAKGLLRRGKLDELRQ